MCRAPETTAAHDMKSLFAIIALLALCACDNRSEPDGKPVTAEEAKPALKQTSAAAQAAALRRRIMDEHEAGRAAYLEHVEEALREKWPANSGHEDEFNEGMAKARSFYEGMLQDELRQLDEEAPQ
jgi:hypothetical protein